MTFVGRATVFQAFRVESVQAILFTIWASFHTGHMPYVQAQLMAEVEFLNWFCFVLLSCSMCDRTLDSAGYEISLQKHKLLQILILSHVKKAPPPPLQ